jgi:hypothetical protein
MLPSRRVELGGVELFDAGFVDSCAHGAGSDASRETRVGITPIDRVSHADESLADQQLPDHVRTETWSTRGGARRRSRTSTPRGAGGFKPHSSVGTRPLGATGCALICDFAVAHRHLCGPVPCCSGPFVSKALADKRVEHADRWRRSRREPPASHVSPQVTARPRPERTCCVTSVAKPQAGASRIGKPLLR